MMSQPAPVPNVPRPDQVEPSSPAGALLAWVGLFALGLICLSGRFDASFPSSPSYHSPAYFLNAALALVFLPTFYYGLRALFPGHGGACRKALGVAWSVLFLPYRWLGLSAFYRSSSYSNVTGAPASRPMHWIQDALGQGISMMPYEILFMGALLGLGYWLMLKAIERRALPKPAARYWGALFALLTITTWMHLGERSPMTYHSLWYDGPAWYGSCLCPDEKCMAEADYFVFKGCEDLFKGEPPSAVGTYQIRRPLTFFVSAQFSYFFNPWYVYLVLNLCAWFVACYCLYLYGAALWNAEIAKYAVLMLACAPGFITNVSQPMLYVGGFSMIAICLGFYQLLFGGEEREAPRSSYVLFGAITGLMLLSYDNYGFVLFFPLASLVRRKPLLPMLGSMAMAVLLFWGFNQLTNSLNLPVNTSNSIYATNTLANIKDMVLAGKGAGLFTGLPGALLIYKRSLLYSLFYVAPLLALVGLLSLGRVRAIIESLFLLIPAFAGISALHFGGMRWVIFELSELPRFAFVAFPGIYLLAGSGIAKIRGWAKSTLGEKDAAYAAFAILALIWLLANLDVFGHPQLYYFYQFPWGGQLPCPWCDPR